MHFTSQRRAMMADLDALRFSIFQFAKVDALRFAFCTLQVRNRAKVDVGCGQIEGGGIIAVRATKLRPPANLPQHILLK